MELGVAIRKRRANQARSLQAVADAAGISRAMLSDIERGAKNPTIKVVCQIAEALGCSVSDLLNRGAPAPALGMSVVRETERQRLVDPQTGIERELLAPSFVSRGVEVVWYSIPPGAETGLFPAHPPGTAEHLTVVEGSLTCSVGGEEVALEAGDSAAFLADVPHRFANMGDAVTRYFLIVDAPRG
ncbi:MAG: cupin domain-containing protein, partial [Chloroflexota bacterium]|nr:cupin domain-containing protein [Chloroflexota bacterium]